MKTLKRTAAAFLILLCPSVAPAVQAQTCEPHWSPEYSHAQVSAHGIAALDLGAGPELYSYGPPIESEYPGYLTSSGIAKWNGSQWVEVGPGLSPSNSSITVDTVTALDDGTGLALWAAGYFHTPGFQADYQVAKWDGSSWVAIPEGLLVGRVFDMEFWNGSLFIAGVFNRPDGLHTALRWNGSTWVSMGLVDQDFYRAGIDLHVHEGTLYLAMYGYFDQQPVNVLAWNGSSWSSIGFVGIDHNRIGGLESYAGDLYAAGSDGVVRWDGTHWSGTGFGPAVVTTLAVFDDGAGERLFAGGWDNPTAGFVRAWDGTGWESLDENQQGNGRTLASVPSGTTRGLYAYGNAFGGMSVNSLARWVDGQWRTLGLGAHSGFSPSEFTSLDLHDGRGEALYVGSPFGSSTCFSTPGAVIRWDGIRGETIARSVGSSYQINALAAAPNGLNRKVRPHPPGSAGDRKPMLFLAGDFSDVDGVPAEDLAMWDGTSWSPVGPGSGAPLVSGSIQALQVTRGHLLVGVQYGSVGGVPCNGVARWNGSSWSAFGEGLASNDVAQAFAEHDDGSGPAVYAATGYGVYRRTSAGWVRLVGGDEPHASPYLYPFRALISHDDGHGPGLFVSGGETGRVHRWRNGTWEGVGESLDDFGLTGFQPSSFAVMDDGSGPKLYLGGFFDSVGGVPASRLARWNGSEWEAVGALQISEDSEGILALFAMTLPGRQNSSLFVGGYFQKLGNVFSAKIGEWLGCP
jgi:hypothetical protein